MVLRLLLLILFLFVELFASLKVVGLKVVFDAVAVVVDIVADVVVASLAVCCS